MSPAALLGNWMPTAFLGCLWSSGIPLDSGTLARLAAVPGSPPVPLFLAFGWLAFGDGGSPVPLAALTRNLVWATAGDRSSPTLLLLGLEYSGEEPHLATVKQQ